DRAGTFEDSYFSAVNFGVESNFHISLHKKHHLINAIHEGPAYDTDNLTQRINYYIDRMIACGTKRADTLVDTTADKLGTSALERVLEIKNQRKHEIDLRVAAYSPLGFRDDEPSRWDILVEGARKADFISALPESDDMDEYPSNIGFMEHCRRFLELAQELKIPLHVHTDQRNEPDEKGTERLIEAVQQWGIPESVGQEPMVWVVHMISPSTYEEDRFQKLATELKELNIGVICCPSAAIGMRQLRSVKTPTYNSIPRVLELLAAGVHVRLASDNIADICSPSTTADLLDEVFILSAAIRFYNVDILATLAAGLPLNPDQIAQIKEHLVQNDLEIAKALNGYA
ncbi:MAG: hypothetical protein AAGH40_13735, partial [Verrucomicrobiota bacterium]